MISSSKFLCFFIATTLAFAQTYYAQNSALDYLNEHNIARALDGVAPLTWDDTAAAYAQNYANLHKDVCIVSATETAGLYGVNWAASPSALFTGVEAVDLWISGKLNYDYITNTCVGDIGLCLAYKQVVWNTIVFVGCGSVTCDTGGTFIACAYSPNVNLLGRRPF